MRRTKILNAETVRKTTFSEAQNAFYKHCRLKNLRPRMDMTRHYVNLYGLDLQRDYARLNPLDNLMKQIRA